MIIWNEIKKGSVMSIFGSSDPVGTDPFSNTRGNAAQDRTEREIRETVARPRALKGSGHVMFEMLGRAQITPVYW